MDDNVALWATLLALPPGQQVAAILVLCSTFALGAWVSQRLTRHDVSKAEAVSERLRTESADLERRLKQAQHDTDRHQQDAQQWKGKADGLEAEMVDWKGRVESWFLEMQERAPGPAPPLPTDRRLPAAHPANDTNDFNALGDVFGSE